MTDRPLSISLQFLRRATPETQRTTCENACKLSPRVLSITCKHTTYIFALRMVWRDHIRPYATWKDLYGYRCLEKTGRGRQTDLGVELGSSFTLQMALRRFSICNFILTLSKEMTTNHSYISVRCRPTESGKIFAPSLRVRVREVFKKSYVSTGRSSWTPSCV